MRMFMSACSPEEPGIVVLTTWVFVLEYTERVVFASWSKNEVHIARFYYVYRRAH